MGYRSAVSTWYNQGIQAPLAPYFGIANAMMNMAFNERDIQSNPFSCVNPNSWLSNDIRERFAETYDLHLEILARPAIQHFEGPGVGLDYFVHQLGSVLSAFSRLTDQHNRTILAIFCCRYAVQNHLRGQIRVTNAVILVVAGMMSGS